MPRAGGEGIYGGGAPKGNRNALKHGAPSAETPLGEFPLFVSTARVAIVQPPRLPPPAPMPPEGVCGPLPLNG